MKITNKTSRTLEIKIDNDNDDFQNRIITQIPNAITEVPICCGDTIVIIEK